MTFNCDTFIKNCISASTDEGAERNITKLVQKAISNPEQLFKELDEPSKAIIEKMYVSDDLTILNLAWAPLMTLRPHNHNTWAVIGVYSGREDNIFWCQLQEDPNGMIEAVGAKSIATGEVVALGKHLSYSKLRIPF